MAKRKSTREKKKQKRIRPEVNDLNQPPGLSGLPHIKDQLDDVIAVVRTVVDAINDENDQHLAMVLQEYGLHPLYDLKERLDGDEGGDA